MGNLIRHLVYTGLLLECDRTLYNFWSHTYIQCAHNRQCLAAVFLPQLERELWDFVKHWNSHRMRHNRRAGCPNGIPDDLFDMPEQFGMESIYAWSDHQWKCYLHVM